MAQAFAQRRAQFLEQVEAVSKSKQEAEDQLAEVSHRLEAIKSSFDTQVLEAKKKAEEAYREQVTEARNGAEKLKSMVQSNLAFEAQKEMESLRVETFKRSAQEARKKLEASLTPEQIKGWTSQFTTERMH